MKERKGCLCICGVRQRERRNLFFLRRRKGRRMETTREKKKREILYNHSCRTQTSEDSLNITTQQLALCRWNLSFLLSFSLSAFVSILLPSFLLFLPRAPLRQLTERDEKTEGEVEERRRKKGEKKEKETDSKLRGMKKRKKERRAENEGDRWRRRRMTEAPRASEGNFPFHLLLLLQNKAERKTISGRERERKEEEKQMDGCVVQI